MRRSPRQTGQVGFTLIELMVALLIFGMISAAGVAMLSSGVRAEAAVGVRLDDVAAVTRLGSALSADLAQASARATRDEVGRTTPPFIGARDGAAVPFIELVRNGWTNLDEAPRASLQKVAYRVEGNALVRIAYPMLDGARPLPPVTMLTGVMRVSARYRLAGAWSDGWSPIGRDLLPDAMELTITRVDGTTIRQVFLVGTGYDADAPPPGGSDGEQ